MLCIANYIAAAALDNSLAEFIMWLQGDFLKVGSYSSCVLLVCFALFGWLISSHAKEIPACLLAGLGFGIAGPVFFVSCLIPAVMRNQFNSITGKSFIVACAAVGALFVALLDAIPRLLLGGYSPTLIIPLAIVAVPLLLFYHRSNRLMGFPNKGRAMVEAGVIALWIVGFTVILFHVISYANPLI